MPVEIKESEVFRISDSRGPSYKYKEVTLVDPTTQSSILKATIYGDSGYADIRFPNISESGSNSEPMQLMVHNLKDSNLGKLSGRLTQRAEEIRPQLSPLEYSSLSSLWALIASNSGLSEFAQAIMNALREVQSNDS